MHNPSEPFTIIQPIQYLHNTVSNYTVVSSSSLSRVLSFFYTPHFSLPYFLITSPSRKSRGDFSVLSARKQTVNPLALSLPLLTVYDVYPAALAASPLECTCGAVPTNPRLTPFHPAFAAFRLQLLLLLLLLQYRK